MPQHSFNVSDPIAVRDTLLAAALELRSSRGDSGCVHPIPSEGQLFVSGDLHDNPFHFTKLVQLADLENPANHLLLQEIIHATDATLELDLSHRMLIRAAALLLEFKGQVHPILANHELSQMTNRRITKNGVELVQRFDEGVEHVFARNADMVKEAINVFIAAMPLAVKSESGLMCCHSLPNEVMMPEFNEHILDKALGPEDYRSDASAYFMVWGRQHTQEQLDKLAKSWGVKLFCLGHAWVPDGIRAEFKNMLQLNSDHAKGVVLPVNLEKIQDATHTASMAIKLGSIRIDVT